MLATGKDDFGTVADNSYLGKAALNRGTDWTSFIDGSYDDAQVGDLCSFSQRHLLTYCVCLCLWFSGVFWLSGKLLITRLPEGKTAPHIWSASACERNILRP